jgi:hypothetical protein
LFGRNPNQKPTKRRPVKEKVIEQKFRDLCIAEGWLCIKMVQTGLVGIPDRLVIVPSGQYIWVELKSSVGKLSPIQVAAHQKLRHNKAIVLTGCEPFTLMAECAILAGYYSVWLKYGPQRVIKLKR